MKQSSPVKIWRNSKTIKSLVGKKGKIIGYTIIRVPPGDFSGYGSYPVAIVLLEDKSTMILQIVDVLESDLAIGKKIILVLRRSRLEDKEEVISYYIKGKLL